MNSATNKSRRCRTSFLSPHHLLMDILIMVETYLNIHFVIQEPSTQHVMDILSFSFFLNFNCFQHVMESAPDKSTRSLIMLLHPQFRDIINMEFLRIEKTSQGLTLHKLLSTRIKIYNYFVPFSRILNPISTTNKQQRCLTRYGCTPMKWISQHTESIISRLEYLPTHLIRCIQNKLHGQDSSQMSKLTTDLLVDYTNQQQIFRSSVMLDYTSNEVEENLEDIDVTRLHENRFSFRTESWIQGDVTRKVVDMVRSGK